MKEQTNIAANNSLKTKLALGVFSVAGLTATAGLMNNITASADDTTTNENTSQNQETANAANTQAYALPASQTTAPDLKVGDNVLPSPALDNAVKQAQAAGVDTQETPGKTYTGTPNQYPAIKQDSDKDYAQQVDGINNLLAQIQEYNAKASAADSENAVVVNQANKDKANGVNVIRDHDQKGLNFDQIKNDDAAQFANLQAALAQKLQQDSDRSKAVQADAKANSDVKKAAAEAAANGVDITQDGDVAGDDISWVVADAKNQVDTLKKANADQEAKMAAYKAALDKVKSDNAAKQADYDKAEKAYEDAKAENAKLKAAYDQAMKDYEAQMSIWNAANKGKDGYTSHGLSQALKLNEEPNASTSFSKSGNVTWLQKQQPTSDENGTPVSNPVSGNYYPTATTIGGHATQWTRAEVGQGGSVTVEYGNLSNSTYQGKKISKIVKTFQYEDNLNGQPMLLDIPQDPSMDVWYSSEKGAEGSPQEYTRGITETDKYYDADGNQITFDDDAVITVGSLNNFKPEAGTNHQHLEEARVDNADFVPVNGGTVADHDGWAYSEDDNSANKKDETWDNVNKPNFYIGTAVYRLKAGTKDVVLHLRTPSGANDGNRWTWAQSSTLVPGGAGPDKPVAPNYVPENKPAQPDLEPDPAMPAPEKVSYHLYKAPKASAGVNVHYHVNVLPDNPADKGVKYHYNHMKVVLPGHPAKPAHPAKPYLPETGKQAQVETISTSAAYFFGISAAMSLVAAFALRRKQEK